jgi:hypothetical protein
MKWVSSTGLRAPVSKLGRPVFVTAHVAFSAAGLGRRALMWNRIELAALSDITVPTLAFIGDRERRALA